MKREREGERQVVRREKRKSGRKRRRWVCNWLDRRDMEKERETKDRERE